MSRIDVEALRREHPLTEVVAASGVELFPRGNGFMARCPFHDHDRTPSMSVDGVPGRFHCFGCGAGGDVIDFVARLEGLDFRAAAERLAGAENLPEIVRPATVITSPALGRTARRRVVELNTHAWEFFTEPGKRDQAEHYIRHARGIDLEQILTRTSGLPVVGLATTGWDALPAHLQRHGASAEEIIDAGLGRDHAGRLVDTFRGRVVVAVRDSHGDIEGFLGRDISGNARAPKYLNPTRTVAYDKSRSTYWPLGRPSQVECQVVVVEGFIDALAVAANRHIGAEPSFPCSAGGTSVSTHQASQVAALTTRPVLLALDADTAGRAGANRWRHQLEELGRTTQILNLPDGLDPAEALRGSVVHDLSL